MENQEKQSLISQLMNFTFKLIKEQTPSSEEFKTQPTKAILRVLLLIFGVIFYLLLVGIILGLYIFSFFLRILGNIFLFGAAADFLHNRNQENYYEENIH